MCEFGTATIKDNMVMCGITVYVLATISMARSVRRGQACQPEGFREGRRTRGAARKQAGNYVCRGSAVSKYVADLENDLGVHLINRTTRRASPTENGQPYFERVLAILADLDAADRSVAHLQSTPRGLLRVNAPMSFGTITLGPVIADFMALHPELQIQLVLSDEQVDPMQEGLHAADRGA
jgi:hypothetical protein